MSETEGGQGGWAFKQPRRRAVSILGVPVEAGAGVAGCAMGPAMLRTAGIVRTLKDLGQDIVDRGDLSLPHPPVHPHPPEGRARHFAEISAWARILARETYAVMREGRLPIVLGGDHSLAMGSIAGVARHAGEAGRKLFVLWLDAHSDYNTPRTSPSGNMHGMPVAMLSGEPGFDDLFGDEPRGLVDPAHVHLFGIRSIDADERRLLQTRGVDVVDMRRLDEDGFALSIRRIIDRVRAAGGLLHVESRRRFPRSNDRPGGRDGGSGRRYISRGSSGDGAFYRVRPVAFARYRRTQSVPRRTGTKRSAAGRPDREPFRAAGVLEKQHCNFQGLLFEMADLGLDHELSNPLTDCNHLTIRMLSPFLRRLGRLCAKSSA